MVGSGWFMFFVGLGAKRTDRQTYIQTDISTKIWNVSGDVKVT
jgi:hypothetical protein